MSNTRMKLFVVIVLVDLFILIFFMAHHPHLDSHFAEKQCNLEKTIFLSFELCYSSYIPSDTQELDENNQNQRIFSIPYSHYDRNLFLSNRKHDSIPLVYYQQNIQTSKVTLLAWVLKMLFFLQEERMSLISWNKIGRAHV